MFWLSSEFTKNKEYFLYFGKKDKKGRLKKAKIKLKNIKNKTDNKIGFKEEVYFFVIVKNLSKILMKYKRK